jgi:dihydrolipoamide dehydrogenase
MMKKKEKIVSQLTGGIEFLFKKNKVDYIKGWGSFKDKNTISANLLAGGNQDITAKNILIATGSEPTALPFLQFDEETFVSSTGALALKQVPKHLIVIGGGVIGCEMGSVYKRLGSEVTVVEFMDRICATMDAEITVHFQKVLAKQGIAQFPSLIPQE